MPVARRRRASGRSIGVKKKESPAWSGGARRVSGAFALALSRMTDTYRGIFRCCLVPSCRSNSSHRWAISRQVAAPSLSPDASSRFARSVAAAGARDPCWRIMTPAERHRSISEGAALLSRPRLIQRSVADIRDDHRLELLCSLFPFFGGGPCAFLGVPRGLWPSGEPPLSISYLATLPSHFATMFVERGYARWRRLIAI